MPDVLSRSATALPAKALAANGFATMQTALKRADLFRAILDGVTFAASAGQVSILPFTPVRPPEDRPAGDRLTGDRLTGDRLTGDRAVTADSDSRPDERPLDLPLADAQPALPPVVADRACGSEGVPALECPVGDAAPVDAVRPHPPASAHAPAAGSVVAPEAVALAPAAPPPDPSIGATGPGSAQGAASPATNPAPTEVMVRQAQELARHAPPGTRLDIRVDVAGASETVAAKTAAAAPTSGAGVGSGGVGGQGGRAPGQPAQSAAVAPATPPADAGAPGPWPAIAAAPAAEAMRAAADPDGAPGQGTIAGSQLCADGEIVAGQPGASAAAALPVRAGDVLAATAARAGVARPVSLQVAVSIDQAVRQGRDRIEIELRPDALGRIEVRLDIERDGRVSAIILADQPDTLDVLRADARGLERALQEAGLKTDSGSLSFSLRDGGTGDGGQRPPFAPHAAVRGHAPDAPEAVSSTSVSQAGPPRPPGDRRIDVRA